MIAKLEVEDNSVPDAMAFFFIFLDIMVQHIFKYSLENMTWQFRFGIFTLF